MTTGELVESRGLSADRLAQIEGMEAACAADGRIKLEYPTLRGRPSDQVNDLFWVEGGETVGFAGLYRFGFGPVEIAGMVHPSFRRRGIGRRLLEGALRLPAAREAALRLLLADRRSEGGLAFAAAVGGRLQHSEHLMTLEEPAPAAAPAAAGLTMRAAGPGDAAFVDRLVREEFGMPGTQADGPAPAPEEPGPWSRILEVDGHPVGTIRNELASGNGYIAGFVVAREHRGRGLGRAGLRLAVDELLAAGAGTILLEVETTNDRALGLYLDAGFRRVSTMDYFELPVASA
jgi:ribosomal protein S18 acetylase RimI-like enzyme